MRCKLTEATSAVMRDQAGDYFHTYLPTIWGGGMKKLLVSFKTQFEEKNYKKQLFLV